MKQAFRMTIFVTVLCGIIFPVLLTLAAQAITPDKANGSLIEKDGQLVGSELIAQPFTSDDYFHGRPSAVDQLKGLSAGDNLAVTNPERSVQIAKRMEQGPLPDDAVTTSGSGFDPHISLDYARAQINRIAKARGLSSDRLEQLIDDLAGDSSYVNVLLLNLALDELGS